MGFMDLVRVDPESVANAVSENPDILDEAVALAQSTAGLAGSLQLESLDAEGWVGDEDGRPSWLQFDALGMPSAAALNALKGKGVPLAQGDGLDGGGIGDADGALSWLQWGPDGMPNLYAMQAIAIALGLWRGPVQPNFFPPGRSYTWFKTDPATGELTDILNGKG